MKLLVVVVFALLARTAVADDLDEKRLSQALQDLPHIKLDPEDADQLAAIAIEVAQDDLDPLTLLAQQYVESRFNPTATSRLIDGKRQTGLWPSRKEPAGWSGNLYCGIAQNAASTWEACLALRETRAAVTRQAAELRRWLKRTRGDLVRALAGYGCGNHGVETGRCNGYQGRVKALAARLRRAARVDVSG